jgi:flagellar basal-body rod protein FlgG
MTVALGFHQYEQWNCPGLKTGRLAENPGFRYRSAARHSLGLVIRAVMDAGIRRAGGRRKESTMGWNRHTGAIVSLALVASVVANYSVHRHFERRFQKLLAIAPIDGRLPPGQPLFDSHDECDPSPIPRYLGATDENQHGGTILPALQIRDVENQPAASPGRSQPNPVPAPNDAVPIAGDEKTRSDDSTRRPTTVSLDAVRKVIEEELAGASREEREIWFEELKTLPAGVVRDLLKVRKQLHALPNTHHWKDAPASKGVPKVASIFAQPAAQSYRHELTDWQPTMDAFERMCAISRHNLANSATPGFKRLRATLVDSVATTNPDFSPDGEHPEDSATSSTLETTQLDGCRLGAIVLDVAPGRLLKTERPLDLAIDGEGWFAVLTGDRVLYTRCGAFVLDSQRRLALAVADEMPALQPVIQIPDDAREIEISANGDVLILRQLGEDSEVVGRLHVVRFASPSRLKPLGGGLYASTNASGEPKSDAPDQGGRGTIQQGCLEQSNVDTEQELADIEQWQGLQKSFPTVSRPVTARGAEPDPR